MWWLIAFLYLLPGYTLSMAILIYDIDTVDIDTWFQKVIFFLLVTLCFPVAFIYLIYKEKNLRSAWTQVTRTNELPENERLKNENRKLKQRAEEAVENMRGYELRLSALLIENESLRKEDPIARMKREIKDASK